MSRSDYQEEIGIAGSGKIAGGEYGSLNISGSGRVTGDVIANNVSVRDQANLTVIWKPIG